MGPIILAIESSCDDTAAAVIQNGTILSNVVANQEVHQKWGGVVPELASRAHMANIIPTVDLALKQAEIEKSQLQAIAFTQGPGLLGSLLVGTCFAKGFAQSLDIPLIPVNHMKAHILAHFIDDPKPNFPFLCLTVSGGHTQIVLVEDHAKMTVIGETLDDAAGEAFDKAAKIMGLPYPGGPLVDKYAQEGDERAFDFAKSRVPDLSFSFSGIKTSILYFLKKRMAEDPEFIDKNLKDLCASIQRNIVEMLTDKLVKATKKTGIKEVAIAGGVSANSELRKQLGIFGKNRGWNTYIPKFEYCTDNAAMIAITAHYKYLAGDFGDLTTVPMARMKI